MNILILGGTGKIGNVIFQELSSYKKYNIYTLSKSKNETNAKKHYIFDLFRTDLSNININLNFDIIINCLGVNVFKRKDLIYNIYNKFLDLLISNTKSTWIEISSISAFGVIGFNNKKTLLSDYGNTKLHSEKLLRNLSKKKNKNNIIFRFGAVLPKEDFENFILIKFKRFKVFNFFLNFFYNKPLLRITFIEDVCELINKIILENEKSNKIIVSYKNINIYELFKIRYENLYIINLNYKIISFFLLINKIMYLKYLSIFNPNLNSDKKEIFYKIDF